MTPPMRASGAAVSSLHASVEQFLTDVLSTAKLVPDEERSQFALEALSAVRDAVRTEDTEPLDDFAAEWTVMW